MRVIVMFDLPMVSSQDIRTYTRFRKYLLKSGFMMMQESVYCKLALNGTVAEGIINGIKRNKPEKGFVQALNLTEKQFNRIEIIVGESRSDIIDSDERLVIL